MTERPLRVVLAVCSLRIGGTETQTVKLAAGLARRGHDVDVLALFGGGPLQTELATAGVPARVFAYPGLRVDGRRSRVSARNLALSLRELWRVLRYLRDRRPDVVHASMFGCYTLVIPLAWAARVPARVTGRRGAIPSRASVGYRALEWLGRRTATRHICNSAAGATDAIREGVPAARLRVIPNAVELPRRSADVRPQPPTAVVVANLRAVKGHNDLIEALALLRDPPRVDFIGAGDQFDRLAALVDALDLNDRVGFLGSVPDASRRLPHYQFAVLPSHREGLPNAVLEAMAAGLPVIATAVGGVPELVTDGVTGLLVPPRKPRALADAVARLAADPVLRHRMGGAARQAAQRFGADRCVDAYESLFSSPDPEPDAARQATRV